MNKSDELYKSLIDAIVRVRAPYNVDPTNVRVSLQVFLRNRFAFTVDFGILTEPHVPLTVISVGALGDLTMWLELTSVSAAAIVQFIQRYRVRWDPVKVEYGPEDLAVPEITLTFSDENPLYIEVPRPDSAEIEAVDSSKQNIAKIVGVGSSKLVRTRLVYRGHVDGITINMLRRRATLARRGVDYARSSKNNRKGLPHSRPSTVPIVNVLPVRQYYWVDGTIITNAAGSRPVTTYSRTEARTLTPNYFSLQKSKRPVNPYFMSESRTLAPLGYQRCVSGGLSPTQEHFWVAPAEWAYVPPAPDFTPDASVEGKAYARLVQDTGIESFNLAVDLVQFRQATDMIAANLTRITRAYVSLRRGNIAGATADLFDNRPPRFRKGKSPTINQSVANNWLELQYGWKPLLADIHELIQHLHLQYRDYLRSARSSAKGESRREVVHQGPFSISINGVNPDVVGKTIIKKSTKVRYGVNYRLHDKDLSFLAQTGFTNPVNLAWELIPFSFVVDWAYPLGPYLERLTAWQGLVFVGGWKTTFVREELTTVISGNRGVLVSGGSWQIETEFRASRDSVQMRREKLTTFPSQPTPAFKNPFSVTHAANALALMTTTFYQGDKIRRNPL